MEYSGPGNVRAAVHPVDVHLAPPRASTSGCEAADFAGFPRGQIALIQRGTCEFGVKTRNARTAGAAAVVVFNQGNGDPGHDADRFTSVAGTLDGPTTIPVVGVSYAVGAALAATPGTVVEIDADTESETRTTQNLIAESPQGRSDNVVMAGAHLDSVAEGPGINDNGTGSAALLEVALQYAPLAKRFAPVNKVRFAWWGAEEEGLVGSDRYVKQLTPKQVKDIGLYLNFDMLASPNYLLAVQDGNHSSHDSDPAPKGSAAIEKLFRNYLTGRGQHPFDADFDGRSDYGPFIDEDIAIPSGGLETGAEGIKTAADVRLFGGVAGAPFDPCYHKACDSLVPLAHHAPQVTYDRLRHAYGAALLGNVNLTALDLMTGAMADAIGRLAFDTTGISAPAPAPSPAP
jgi:Zn-dependent M28 family amino/carboxypeptidase